MSQCRGQVLRHKGDMAVVGGFPDLRQLSSTGVSDTGASLARVKKQNKCQE
ncbi:hypothetical protein [Nostoc sp. FACHB-110]|uniref:hypothetical protein n=1 Tax=Nostoc sp. FACHB-110 TaxID=2692834 RepID=UPI001688D410|nr:hypothetical protein [Nostoc sp. FACHB-110]MBD2435466.1 hypothetical protein [Nostoc sp. FACHB-110]